MFLMETDRLRYFCVIAECESLTKAAEILNISHSGLSKSMGVLQQETSLQLLRPVGRGIEITDQGREFYKKAQEILGLISKISEKEDGKAAEIIKIGLAEIFAVSVAGDMACALEASLNFYEFDSGLGEAHLLEREIDFAISFVPFPHPDLEYLKIKKTHMGVYVSHKEMLKIPFHELPFVTPSHSMRENPLSLKSRDGWPSQSQRFKFIGVGSLSSALAIVDQGLCAVFIPQFVAKCLNRQRSSHFKLLPYPVDAKILKQSARDIFIVKRKDIEESPAMKKVAKIIRQLC